MATDFSPAPDFISKPSRHHHERVAKLPVYATPRETLQHWVRAGTTPQRVVTRSRIALLSLDGTPPRLIATILGISRTTATLWTTRFQRDGLAALVHDAPGRGRHGRVTRDVLLVRLRDAGLLRADDTPISLRRAAAALGLAPSTVSRILKRVSR